MPSFKSDGVEIAFLDEGQGMPILLIHGFASNKTVNWVDTGWVRHLTRLGLRVIAIDNRGHGESAKLHDPAGYGGPIMAEDARLLVGGDIAVDQPQFAVLDRGVAVGDVGLAGAQRLHLGPGQDDADLKIAFDEVIEPRAAVFGDHLVVGV